jgi:hypothetical protein
VRDLLHFIEELFINVLISEEIQAFLGSFKPKRGSHVPFNQKQGINICFLSIKCLNSDFGAICLAFPQFSPKKRP